MNTLHSLGIMFGLFTVGLVFVFIVIMLMGAAGFPGAAVIESGRKSDNDIQRLLGVALAAVGQGFVACSYTVFVVSALRAFSDVNGHLPTWPLWIAAIYQSGAAPAYLLQQNPPADHKKCLDWVSGAVAICLVVIAFIPNALSVPFGWVPFFDSNIK